MEGKIDFTTNYLDDDLILFGYVENIDCLSDEEIKKKIIENIVKIDVKMIEKIIVHVCEYTTDINKFQGDEKYLDDKMNRVVNILKNLLPNSIETFKRYYMRSNLPDHVLIIKFIRKVS